MKKRITKAGREYLPGGPIPKHGGYSIAACDALLLSQPEIRHYLKAVRAGLVHDLSPEGEGHMTMARVLILDRLMQKLATARLIEAYLAEHGILRPDRMAERVLEGHSVMNLWLTINNQIRADLLTLGLDRKALEAEILTPAELLLAAGQDVADEEARAAAKDAEVVDPETSSAASEAEEGGERDKTPGA